MARKRDYQAEYRRRIERGLERGLSRSRARGHAKAAERKAKTEQPRPDAALNAAILAMNRGTHSLRPLAPPTFLRNVFEGSSRLSTRPAQGATLGHARRSAAPGPRDHQRWVPGGDGRRLLQHGSLVSTTTRRVLLFARTISIC